MWKLHMSEEQTTCPNPEWSVNDNKVGEKTEGTFGTYNQLYLTDTLVSLSSTNKNFI